MVSENLVRRGVRLRKVLCSLVVAIGLLGGGCLRLPALPGVQELPLQQQVSPLPPGPVCRIAVLPFLNDSKFPFADAIVNKVFMAQFQAAGFPVVQEGDILKLYQQLHLLPGVPPTQEQMQIISERTDSPLLVTGIVMMMKEEYGERGAIDPLVVMEIQIRDGRSAETLWTTYHHRHGLDYKDIMHFGTIHTVTGLSQQMVSEIIKLWLKKGLTPCNDFFRS